MNSPDQDFADAMILDLNRTMYIEGVSLNQSGEQVVRRGIAHLYGRITAYQERIVRLEQLADRGPQNEAAPPSEANHGL